MRHNNDRRVDRLGDRVAELQAEREFERVAQQQGLSMDALMAECERLQQEYGDKQSDVAAGLSRELGVPAEDLVRYGERIMRSGDSGG